MGYLSRGNGYEWSSYQKKTCTNAGIVKFKHVVNVLFNLRVEVTKINGDC